MRKQKSILYWLILSSILFYFSCRRQDSEILTPGRSISIDRFFDLPGREELLELEALVVIR